MKFERELSVKNLKRKPARTVALVLLAAFLSFSIFGGSVIVMSLQNGLHSYESRLGADIVVIPNQAKTKGTLDSILLQGVPGYFYMDNTYLEKISAIEGVEAASPQFFLASASAGCCSVSVQIIGFDPDTDFSVQPWIRENYAGEIGEGDVIVGSSITVPKNRTLTFYNTDCHIVAQLDETGTGLDNAIYADMNTIKTMMTNAQALGFHDFDEVNAGKAISSVMIKVRDGYSIQDVTDDINIHVRRVQATQAKSMISNISGGLNNVSHIIGLLTVMIWILSLVILMITFVMIANERTKEFAVLRVVGASQRMLTRLLMTESVMISGIGAVAGVLMACLFVFPFSGLIHSSLNLPYLLPSVGSLAALLVGSVALSIVAGGLTACVSAYRIGKNDTALILREGA